MRDGGSVRGAAGEAGAMLVVGVAGLVGSGKSTLCGLLARKGAALIEADEIGHVLLEPGTRVAREIVRRFGSRILDARGAIDRKRLGTTVFADPHALRFLSRLTGPEIVLETRRRLDRLAAGRFRGIVVIDAALLLDWQPRRFVDRIVFVAARREIRRRRATASRRMTREGFDRRDRSQRRFEGRVREADYLLYNDGDLDDLKRKAGALWARLEDLPRPRPQKMRVKMRRKEED